MSHNHHGRAPMAPHCGRRLQARLDIGSLSPMHARRNNLLALMTLVAFVFAGLAAT